MKLDITKKITMEEYGDDWKDCYVEFTLMTEREAQAIKKAGDDKNEDAIMKIINDKFVSGLVISEGKKVELKQEDLLDLPVTFLVKCFQEINGKISPN